MAKWVCAYCGKELKMRKGIRACNLNSKTYRFCNTEEYDIWRAEFDRLVAQKNNVIKFLFDFFDVDDQKVCNVIRGEVKELCSMYSADDVYEYLQKRSTHLKTIMGRKYFTSDYNKVKYVTAIIRNEMEKYESKTSEETEEETEQDAKPKETTDFYMSPLNAMLTKKPVTNKRRAMSMIEEGEDEEEDDDI